MSTHNITRKLGHGDLFSDKGNRKDDYTLLLQKDNYIMLLDLAL